MYILLSLSDQTALARLEEPDDCTRFHVTIRSLSENQVGKVLSDEQLGELEDPAAAWIRISVLRNLAAGRVAPGWHDRFEKMLSYAERKGWLSHNRESVRGHCQWVESKKS